MQYVCGKGERSGLRGQDGHNYNLLYNERKTEAYKANGKYSILAVVPVFTLVTYIHYIVHYSVQLYCVVTDSSLGSDRPRYPVQVYIVFEAVLYSVLFCILPRNCASVKTYWSKI